MVAAVEGSVGIVMKLVQQGANMNLTNKVTELVLYPCVCGTSGDHVRNGNKKWMQKYRTAILIHFIGNIACISRSDIINKV